MHEKESEEAEEATDKNENNHNNNNNNLQLGIRRRATMRKYIHRTYTCTHTLASFALLSPFSIVVGGRRSCCWEVSPTSSEITADTDCFCFAFHFFFCFSSFVCTRRCLLNVHTVVDVAVCASILLSSNIGTERCRCVLI